ncbi:YfbM family protein [Streptomyces sp. NPDC004609]|uniref:YfbM family protein n=1 Tax=Streptomyces sp. NPDC004609 TaxID=3364704 RepID=UPI0036B5BA31
MSTEPTAAPGRRGAPARNRGPGSLARTLLMAAVVTLVSPGRVERGRLVVTGLGCHFAIEPAEALRLAEADSGEVMAYVAEAEEDPDSRYGDGPWKVDTDRAWDALHRCLTDGTLTYGGGPYPLSYTVLGGRLLTDEEHEYIVVLATPQQTREAAAALADIDEPWLRARFFGLGLTERDGYRGAGDERDFQCTWENFVAVRAFYERAAGAGRAVLFTADA